MMNGLLILCHLTKNQTVHIKPNFQLLKEIKMHVQTERIVHVRTPKGKTVPFLPNTLLTKEVCPSMKSWEEIIRDHLLSRGIEYVKGRVNKVLPYRMLLTRLFCLVMTQGAKHRQSSASSSEFHHGTSYRHIDEDEDMHDEGTSRLSTPSPTSYHDSLSLIIPETFKDPSEDEQNIETMLKGQTLMLNRQSSMHEEQGEHLSQSGRPFESTFKNSSSTTYTKSSTIGHNYFIITVSFLDYAFANPSLPPPSLPIMGHLIQLNLLDIHGVVLEAKIGGFGVDLRVEMVEKWVHLVAELGLKRVRLGAEVDSDALDVVVDSLRLAYEGLEALEIVVIRSSNQVMANQLLQVVSRARFYKWYQEPGAAGYRQVKVLEFFDCPGLRQGVEDSRELLHKQRVKRMASMNTRLNIKKLDGNIVQKHGGSKQVGFKQLGPGVETGVHEVHDENVFGLRWNCKELKGIVKLRFFRSTQQCVKSGVAKHLGVVGIQQQNGLVNETNVTLFAKVVLYRNMGFNESEEYKKTFIGSGVGTGSMQVLHRFKFEVKPLGDHTFEVEPQENIDQGAGLQEVQTQDLIYYQLARDMEQHLACELFGYRENSNEAAFVVAAVEKIYAHESLTFNNTVSCEVIFKWKAGLKDDMDARSDVYVLSNGYRKCSNDSDGYYWAEIWATKGLLAKAKGNILSMEIVRDHSGNTLRVSQSRFYNEKLVQTLLEGYSILSLKGSLSGDCDVERMTDVQVFVDFDYTMERLITIMAGYMTFTDAWKKEIWLKRLLTESRYELRLVAGIATGALVKGGFRYECGSVYRSFTAEGALKRTRMLVDSTLAATIAVNCLSDLTFETA
nr:zinc finger, CCHC-type [Tanacetum cinerariifolium]